MKRLTLILKPTVLCNCECRYCITPTHIPRKLMSLSTIEVLCEKISRSTKFDTFTFIWHGGEPMLMGVDWYKDVLNIQNKYLKHGRFVNTFQSNCTLIDDTWIDFLKLYKIRVSTSLDGDQELHDANRIKNGKGTFEEIIKNIKILQESNLLAGAVCVLSKTNISYVDRFLKFFALHQIPVRLNPILPSERVLKSEEDMSISAIEYADCLIQCYDKWVNGYFDDEQRKPLPIAPLTEIVYNIFHPEHPRLCNFSGTCGSTFLAINPLGDLFNCGRFCDIDDFKIANINDDFYAIDEIFDHKRELVKWTLAPDDECNSCEWFSMCNRGCPNSSFLFYSEIRDRDPYCVGYKKLFKHIYNHLNLEMSKATC